MKKNLKNTYYLLRHGRNIHQTELKDIYLKAFRTLLTSRLFDKKAMKLIKQGKSLFFLFVDKSRSSHHISYYKNAQP